MSALIFDPFSGVSGDMILGAFVDLGLPTAWLRDFVSSLNVGDVAVEIGRTDRSGISCGRVRFELPAEDEPRSLDDVLEIVEASAAPERAKRRAENVFRVLADAEAAVHGVAADDVHFHEVGALDAVLDVLCAVAAVEKLGLSEFYSRAIAVGSGSIEMSHGTFPLPAPATLKLLDGMEVRESGHAEECTTPTGAALVRTLTDTRRAPERFVARRSGYGAGSRDPDGHPNCLRVVVCDPVCDGDRERMYMVQADLDDMAPEYLPAARDALLDAGARDTVLLGIGMKKGRPGHRIEALVEEHTLDAVLDALFRATSTIGARYWAVTRPELGRVHDTIEWRGHEIGVKHVRLADGTERSKPEFDDVARAARSEGLSAHEARRAIDDERGRAGADSRADGSERMN